MIFIAAVALFGIAIGIIGHFHSYRGYGLHGNLLNKSDDAPAYLLIGIGVALLIILLIAVIVGKPIHFS